MTDQIENCSNGREAGWGTGIRENLLTGVSRHEVQVLEDGSLIKVFRTDVDQCKSTIESESRRYVANMQEENPTKSYDLRSNFNESPHRGSVEFKGWGF